MYSSPTYRLLNIGGYSGYASLTEGNAQDRRRGWKGNRGLRTRRQHLIHAAQMGQSDLKAGATASRISTRPGLQRSGCVANRPNRGDNSTVRALKVANVNTNVNVLRKSV